MTPMHLDPDRCVAAVRSKDARFDGWFVTGVVSTGIYCRPSCPAITPKVRNMRFYPSAAAAQGEGFRACRRCRPDATPGSPEWGARSDLVARAVRLVADGVVDREGVVGLSRRLGYSVRQVERLVRAELGAGPLALARAQRAQAARLLVERTDLPMAQVAHAAGFASIRSFNDTFSRVYAATPTELRASVTGRGSSTTSGARPGVAGGARSGAPTSLSLRLPFRGPLHTASLFGHLAATAVPGVEAWTGDALERHLALPGGPAVAVLRPPAAGARHVELTLRLAEVADLAAAIARVRRMLDLDADPEAVDRHLSGDATLAPLVATAPGVRLPGGPDPAEMALRVVLGQQVSTAAAATQAGRLVRAVGRPLPEVFGPGRFCFPTPDAVPAPRRPAPRYAGEPATHAAHRRRGPGRR